jgi:hypothetical protein
MPAKDAEMGAGLLTTRARGAATLAVEIGVMPAADEGTTISPRQKITAAAAAMQVAAVVAMARMTRTREEAGEVVRTGITALPSLRR